MARIEQRRGVDFAEYAEAIGHPTSNVIAAMENGGAAVVIFSLPFDLEEDPFGVDVTALSAKLRRDADGILRLLEEPSPTPFSVAEICEEMARAAGAI